MDGWDVRYSACWADLGLVGVKGKYRWSIGLLKSTSE